MGRLLAGAFAFLATASLFGQPPGRPHDPTAITSRSSAEQARLTAAERDAGWKLLFDGTTTTGWRGLKKAGFPAKGWVVESGRLKHLASGGQPTADSGDIITVDTFYD